MANDIYDRRFSAPIRSEATENEIARRALGHTQPVTILQDFLGRIMPDVGNAAAFQDAERQQYLQKMMETGNQPLDNWGIHTQADPPQGQSAIETIAKLLLNGR